MKGRTMLVGRTKGHRNAHDPGEKESDKNRENDNKLFPKPLKLISYYHTHDYCILFIFTLTCLLRFINSFADFEMVLLERNDNNIKKTT